MSTQDLSGQGQERVRGHSFDGIEEFDNRLPNWWLWSFYLAVIFSLFYWLHFHVLRTGNLPRDNYRIEMTAAAERLAAQLAGMEVSNEMLDKLAAEPAVVARGKQVFATHCVSCHTETGGGNIGPNLTDDYWLHGNQPMDIYATVTKGVEEKGMEPHLSKIGLAPCLDAVAYVMTLRGTNVPGGKEPQGTMVDG